MVNGVEIKARAVTSPLSILIIISFCTFSRADSVECVSCKLIVMDHINGYFLYELAANWLLPFLRFWK